MPFEQPIKKVALFAALTSDQLHEISAAAELVPHPQGNVIITEGDLAKELYIILTGSVQVFTVDKENKEVILARLDQGAFFGEQAYLNNLIRTASVKALSNVELIKINYTILDPIFKKSDKFRQYLEKTSLEKSIANLQTQLVSIDSYVKDIFTKKGFFSSHEEALAKHYNKDDIIFKKGDTADYVYFITEGSVALLFDDTESSQIIINKNQLFGEVAIVQNKLRAATAKAMTNTAVIAVSAKNFLHAIKKSHNLESLVVAYNNVYTLPKNKAIVEQFVGQFQGSQAIFTKYKLQSGKSAICAKVIDQAIFTIKIADEEPDTTLQFKRGELIDRTVFLKNNTIIGMTVFGDWNELNILYQMLLDGITLHGVDTVSFEKTGTLISLSANSSFLQSDIICNCMVVPYKTLKEKVDQGCNEFDKLLFETGACTACGSCKPKLLEILGKTAWTSARIHKNNEFKNDINSFIIKPLHNKLNSFLPGQHIVIKIQINNLFFERAYTLVSPSKDSNQYKVIIKRYEQGAFSNWLFDHAKEPLFIWVSQPSGQFCLKPTEKPILCFAGGIGITPFIAFLRGINEVAMTQKLHIIYSMRNTEDKIIPQDVSSLLNISTNQTLEIWDTINKGKITSEAVEQIVNKINPELVYICGPEGFEKMITEKLQNMQFNPKNILTEKFVSAG